MHMYKIKFTRKDSETITYVICGASDLATAVNGVLECFGAKLDKFITIEQVGKEDL